MKKRVFDSIENLKLKKAKRISEHTRGVHQILSTQTGMVVVLARRPAQLGTTSNEIYT